MYHQISGACRWTDRLEYVRSGGATCSTYLDTIWNVVLIALVVWTHSSVGEVGRVQLKCCDWDPVHGVFPRLAEVNGSAEVGGVDTESVGDGGDTRRKQTISRTSHLATLSCEGISLVLVVPGDNLTQLLNIILTSEHLQLSISQEASIPLDHNYTILDRDSS